MKHSKYTKLLVLVLIVALAAFGAALLASCGGGGDDGGGDSGDGGGGGETVKIGTLYPITGDLAKLGQECVDGVKLAVEEINAAGGIKSMGGAKIEIVEADSQGKPDVGIAEVERLAQQDNVSAIIGTYQSSVAIPATQAAQRLQVPIVISMAVADEITDKGYDNVFRICPKAEWYAKSQLDFCQAMPELNPEYPPIKKIALLHEDTDFGQSTAAGQKKWAAEYGYEIVGEVSYPGSAADLTTQVSKIKAMNPDIVLTTTYLNDAILIVQAREKLGMWQLFFDAAGGTVDPEFISRLGAGADSILTMIEFTKYAGPVAEELNTKFSEKYGRDITGNGAYSYQAVYVIAKALENASSAERAALRDGLIDVKLDKAAGDVVVIPTDVIQFQQDGQIENAPLFVVQIQDGELKPVFPAEYAAAEVILPPK
jgi:branched-chain amino acid transport system substrate-binding protein